MLDIITHKIKKVQFTKYGCGNLTEFPHSKKLTEEIYNIAKTGSYKNKTNVLVTIKLISNLIENYGKEFMNNTYITDDDYKSELYNQFVGDYFEAFCEFFLKYNSEAYGVSDYKAAINTQDWGVDGYGIVTDQRESSGGPTPCVVQVKFRSNPMDEISYTCLAKTGWDGVKNYNLDIKRKKNIILFTNVSGSNYLGKEAIGENLYEISRSTFDDDRSRIKTVQFWEKFLAEFN